PVLGTPQGLAVYQSGVRINEAFGDAVNWDLIPDLAIDRLELVSANPVYGLNALGGAASLIMKDGFNYEGRELEISGGSFRQRSAAAQIGAHDGTLGVYVAGRVLDQHGWHFFANDRIRQFYSALSAHLSAATLDLTYTHADNALYARGATPVQSLALDRRSVFTGPQGTLDRLDFLTLDGSLSLTEHLSLQNVYYYRDYRQFIINGNTTNYAACSSTTVRGQLCQPDGLTAVQDAAGQPIPDLSAGGTLPIGENDFEDIHSHGAGGSWQLHLTQPLVGRENKLSAGAAIDLANIDFSSTTELGVIDRNLNVLPSGLFVDTPESSGFPATPVLLRATDRYYGFYVTDALDLTSMLTVTASARFNIAQIDLYDQHGTNLNGLNRYTHLNPALGATFRLTRSLTAYGGYATTNRAPTASEIECSDPLLPCLLPANLAGDPPNLRQVVAHTFEVGLRGRLDATSGGSGALSWDVGLFRTQLDDDIYAIASSLSTGFFQNIGATRRAGGQANLSWRDARRSAYLNYSYVAGTFQSAFELSSPSSPAQDANGNIQVRPGDRLPGIPRQRVKAGADYEVIAGCSVGATLLLQSSQFYKGDESNQNAPLPGFAVLDLHASWRFGSDSEAFLAIQNVTDRRYATYGIYADPTGVGAPGIPAGAGANDPRVDNRFASLAAPRSLFGGIRIRF
ncbi:MAG: TonB-dependent receptor, partial [Sinobacteraceae bacterium]|nr:TonB-dependent receptor [Nevskiaceae bacterium]